MNETLNSGANTESDKVAKEPELRTILDLFRDVVERLEAHGQELMAFEPKISMNGAKAAPILDTGGPGNVNYVVELRNLLGRLRALEEEKLAPAVTMLRAFL